MYLFVLVSADATKRHAAHIMNACEASLGADDDNTGLYNMGQ